MGIHAIQKCIDVTVELSASARGLCVSLNKLRYFMNKFKRAVHTEKVKELKQKRRRR